MQYGENKTKTFKMHSILDVVHVLVENGNENDKESGLSKRLY